MNRNDRKDMLKRAKAAIGKAKGYILVTFDGKTLPVYRFDVGALKDTQDVRHQAMHKMATSCADTCEALLDVHKSMVKAAEQSRKVEQAKAERSEKLAEFKGPEIEAGRTFQNESVRDAA
jgi:hypothetical protein